MSGGIAINRAGFAVVVGGELSGASGRGGWSPDVGAGRVVRRGRLRGKARVVGSKRRIEPARRPFGGLAGAGVPRSGERWCGSGDSGWLKSVDPGVFTSAVRPAASAFTSGTKVRRWCVP